MAKHELIQAIATKTGFTNAQAEAALDAFGTIITEALIADKKIQLPGMFTASITQRTERKSRNPATDEAMTIPARRVVRFAPASALKSALWTFLNRAA